MDRIKGILNTFRAVFKISMKIYFRYPINIIMTLIEPIIWISPMYFMMKAFSTNGNIPGFEKYTGSSDYVGFIVVGFMVSIYLWTVFWTMGFSLKDEMMQGVLESNWSAPVNRVLLLISKSLFQFCAATFEIILTGIVCHFAFGFTINWNILKVLLFLIPGIIGMLGIGLAIAALVLILKDANTIIDISSGLISGFSGAYWPVKVFGKGFMFVSLMIPLTYVYDGARNILLNQETIFPLKKEFLILILCMFMMCVIGNFIFNRIERKCREKGLLGTH